MEDKEILKIKLENSYLRRVLKSNNTLNKLVYRSLVLYFVILAVEVNQDTVLSILGYILIATFLFLIEAKVLVFASKILRFRKADDV
ncbi:hypothetical protein D6810_02720 [Candidatus Dojkabacteria bacterium]|uniref:Uncharacterized protein n=1 Tax=Candidatus Dojkabacteria bacterium TaxID=2099670 RepID=A0A3M0Z1P3_9BACT|nr:MAG: hypothetical protein D6810_02720 [Candidatus Dojkabacteria bacterium]